MSTQEPTRQNLSRLLSDGIQRCAKSLGRLSYSTWNVDAVAWDSDCAKTILDKIPEGGEDCFGTFLGIPGGGFLVVFPQKSGGLVTNRFTQAGADSIDALPDRESKVLAEVSNIIINTLADALAGACGKSLILSSPEPVKAPRKEILLRTLKRLEPSGACSWVCQARFTSSTFGSDCDFFLFLDNGLAARLASAAKPG
ncbi:MAG TPA: hypothetical protein DEB40_06670 [Elusimicrobia bacterium]|nr:hypothetical protein [Elusimicrobiota bacterium]HBT61411.1 hypothetical protein [Elusimicrobiota bacterium]